MPDAPDSMSKPRVLWLQLRSFGTLWLALASLGGAVVLVGGHWAITFFTKLFGQAGAEPKRVITVLMVLSLPFAVYFWIQQRRLREGDVQCSQCGAAFPKTLSSCPMCGLAHSPEQSRSAVS